ncbi:endonuclease/exonuclease/phosphatase family protein [Nocardiopsis changdeensis]|uniref:Lamin tail domain-containing protein n=1 Tax=Nocardiopsis changdeensis TaxID=2831969 RepID=A0ABX8BUR4_9ACTN|nr:endonuclease/exonuclease/phosphatase family protein [Nocardiopsis changdeensis]QUX25752.1 lamin tail domain-containing protein [Nocardiopsis changdeensis]QYX40216.1 lamin tail domain-containing protein [Nocardiopsis sp. MT53]
MSPPLLPSTPGENVSPTRPRRLIAPTSAAAAAVLLAAALGPVPAAADTGTPVIAEVYGGGGNSGATLRHDFVELGNAADAPVTVDGWSVQYLPAAPKPTTNVQVTPLAGEIPAGGRYLVRQAAGTGGEVDLPAPDAAGSTNMSATAGTVLLVSGTEPVECRTAADCAADGSVVDIVGYGGAEVREGESAPRLSNTTAAARGDGLADTGDNAADFTAGGPTPVNAAGEGPDEGPGEPGGPSEPGDLRIHDIQGVTRVSPHAGDTVSGVPGVVTAVNAFGSAQGFWFQDPEGDGDPRTSEGLFVFTGSTAPGVAPGDEVLVSGRVDEYRPASGTQTITQLDRAQWTVLSTGNAVPESVALEAGVIPAEYAPDHGGDISGLELAPDTYALDFWAAHEHMMVRLEDAPVIAPTDPYHAFWVTVEPGHNRTANGGVAYGSYDDPNAGRVKVESLLDRDVHPFPRVDVGDTLAGVTEGPVYYSRFGGYLVRATTLGEHVPGGLERTPVRGTERYEVSIATYNVENLGGRDDQAKYDALATGIVEYLDAPDIIGLEEIQDDNGEVDDGTVDAGATLDRLTAAIEAQGGPAYEWRQISPEDKQDGGAPGGNIRNAFLFDPARVQFVDRPGGDATTAVEVVRGSRGAELSVSPGRIEPADPAWDDSRKPLVGHFRALNRDIYVVTNHFNSKGGDQALHGVVQPPARTSEQQRNAQAELVAGFADELLAVDPDANLVVMGDLNDFQFSRTLEILTGDGPLYNPMTDLPAPERYNYVFDGNSQALDHILVNREIAGRVDYGIARINSEFHDQVSDHDPQVLWLDTRRSTPPGRS